MVKKLRLYLDTSVFGGYFDKEFEKYTIPFFGRVLNSEFTVLYSTVTQDELINAPERVKELEGMSSISTYFSSSVQSLF